ncbi:hypothetical protein B005_0118 [Nocardiopsis alba ATCC BAA-2165]|uniref:Uncharacterized protein n=1 Tax=Nocardiopsis alba (strain ATCC BAA-2165 / BE74) TaxID=1205910 RepID=J7LBN2_NOCAA|nr:hypothetical protein B005_0118 [Nocardiopsis alba ATCC BAA-2165]
MSTGTSVRRRGHGRTVRRGGGANTAVGRWNAPPGPGVGTR